MKMFTEETAEKMLQNELDRLWEMRRKKEEGLCNEGECRENISASFTKMQDCFAKEELNGISLWPKYVKVAIYTVEEPVFALLQYVKADNYIVLTKRFSDLSASVQRKGEEWINSNIERFGIALYHHILEKINPKDVPSCLALGRYSQKRGDYEMAKFYFETVMDTASETAFNGLTSLLSLYEEEIKATLKKSRKNKKSNSESKISSADDYQVLFLKKNPKIIGKVKEWNPNIRLIGFKLLVGVSKEDLLAAAKASLEKNQAELIVANDLTEISSGQHHAYLLGANTVTEAFSKEEIAEQLLRNIQKGDHL